jgi:hypothetical protein
MKCGYSENQAYAMRATWVPSYEKNQVALLNIKPTHVSTPRFKGANLSTFINLPAFKIHFD